METPRKFTETELEEAFEELDLGMCGAILRAKGIVPSRDNTWLHFDYVPGEHEVREGPAGYTGQICVIGADLREGEIAKLFHMSTEE